VVKNGYHEATTSPGPAQILNVGLFIGTSPGGKMKRCSKCRIWKPLDEFSKDNKRKDRKNCWCNACKSISGKLYKIAHPDKANINRYKRGERVPLQIAKDSGSYLGVYIAERVLANYFSDIERMPTNNRGFDFICKNGFKIDAKSACLTKRNEGSDRWVFIIDHNQTADYFLLLAFDNRTLLNPLHIWLIPGRDINDRGGVHIANTEPSLSKWLQYERPIDGVIASCNMLKGTP
jgi:hypothetical protein